MQWQPDVLAGFEQTTIALPDAADGPVDVVLVRRRSPAGDRAAVLYVHGFVDYFHQAHMVDFFNGQGLHFYAVDLRRHGRSMRPHQWPNNTRSIDEYFADLDAAIEVLEQSEKVNWLLLNGHSTGGLVSALYAHRGQKRGAVDAVFLNSPFLDMNLPAWQERFLEPLIAQLGRFLPKLPLPRLSRMYGVSVNAEARGHWRFDPRWKPIKGFPISAGWFSAIHRAQNEVARGLNIERPVLVLHSQRSLWPKRWSDEIYEADVVLDVGDMIRLAPRLGPDVRITPIPGAMHDLMLSNGKTRERTFAVLGDWLREIRR